MEKRGRGRERGNWKAREREREGKSEGSASTMYGKDQRRNYSRTWHTYAYLVRITVTCWRHTVSVLYAYYGYCVSCNIRWRNRTTTT